MRDEVPDGVRTLVRRRVLTPVTVLLAAVAAAFAVGAQVPTWVQYVPFVLSVVLFGLPHGALDHLVPARLAGRRPDPRSMFGVVAVYAVAGGADLLLWLVAPAAGFVGLLLITWFHWGQGDLWVARELDRASAAGTPVRAALLVATRGALPMVVPLLFHPAAYRGQLVGATGLLDPHAAASVDGLFDPSIRFWVGSGLALLLGAERLLALVAVRSMPGRRVWWRHSVETATLLALFATVPPVLAVGLYFCLWHALRHIVRLQLLDPVAAAALSRARLLPAATRFARDAVPMTCGALALLGGLFAALWRGGDAAALLGLYLVLISMLTVPHVVVVVAMDRRQRVWPRGEAMPTPSVG